MDGLSALGILIGWYIRIGLLIMLPFALWIICVIAKTDWRGIEVRMEELEIKYENKIKELENKPIDIQLKEKDKIVLAHRKEVCALKKEYEGNFDSNAAQIR